MQAILGGKCLDTGEELGPSLTALVDTFVSVAGANRGSFLCLLPFPGACNSVNGLSCISNFIKDINARQRYEGLHVFSVYSPQDDKVGHRNVCGESTSSIPGADQEFQVRERLRHTTIFTFNRNSLFCTNELPNLTASHDFRLRVVDP
ncbi:unnamed protein product [Angiostrongylus costaricensis]|uniref:Uncharacterized protein n=1 Tax=Angiostrongylus costaricensis TaxID=334426 RepID=A0A3P7I2I2_ANGCS|nr:unnamed protein product [Angiostrongylus costaricensis]